MAGSTALTRAMILGRWGLSRTRFCGARRMATRMRDVSVRRRGEGGGCLFNWSVQVLAPCSPGAAQGLCIASKEVGSVKHAHADRRSVTRAVAHEAAHRSPSQAAKTARSVRPGTGHCAMVRPCVPLP